MNYISKLDEYEIYLCEEEKSMNTMKKYVRDVKLFLEHLEEKEISKQQLLLFKEQLIKKYAPSSVNSMLASINKFLEFMQLQFLKIKPVKIQKKVFANPQTELTKEDYQSLLVAAEKSENKRLSRIIQTIGLTGIRVSELEYITVNSLCTGRTIVNCKGKQRTVLIPKQLNKILKDYCREEHIVDGIIFRTKKGKPLDRSNIWKMMKGLCQEAGIAKSKVFPHNLRHLFARTYYNIEKDISKLADILGHADINTTRVYIMDTGKQHEKQINKLSALLCKKQNTT